MTQKKICLGNLGATPPRHGLVTHKSIKVFQSDQTKKKGSQLFLLLRLSGTRVTCNVPQWGKILFEISR